jgi:hypothetical protein
MKLTSVEHIGRSQLISGVRRTFPGVPDGKASRRSAHAAKGRVEPVSVRMRVVVGWKVLRNEPLTSRLDP